MVENIYDFEVMTAFLKNAGIVPKLSVKSLLLKTCLLSTIQSIVRNTLIRPNFAKKLVQSACVSSSVAGRERYLRYRLHRCNRQKLPANAKMRALTPPATFSRPCCCRLLFFSTVEKHFGGHRCGSFEEFGSSTERTSFFLAWYLKIMREMGKK